MDERKIVVVVEEADVSRTALQWALHNIVRCGDVLTLLHVFPYCPPKSRSKKKLRLLRLKGYQLALSFKDICISSSFNTKIEIVVTEDDAEEETIVGLVREMGAFALVIGLHDQSFVYRLAISHNNIRNTFSCKVHAVKQPRPPHSQKTRSYSYTTLQTSHSSPNLQFSQIELSTLELPYLTPQKIRYQICPSPYAVIWRSKKSKRRQRCT